MIDLVDKLPQHPTKRYGYRSIDLIKEVVVHHSATETGSPELFAKFHVDHRNWPGISYHIVIDAKGIAYRCNKYDVISYHTSGRNLNAIGICLIGNFEKHEVPKVQIDKLFEILEEIQEHVGPYEVNWHSKYRATSCPGKHLVKELEEYLYECDGCDLPPTIGTIEL